MGMDSLLIEYTSGSTSGDAYTTHDESGDDRNTTTLTFLTSHYPKFGELFSYSEAVLVTIAVVCLSAFGLVANLLTFFIIQTTKSLKESPFNILIMSLCVSDFLAALHSPLNLYRQVWGYYEYLLPVSVCKLTHGLKNLTDFVTIQHILALCVFRFTTIMFPFSMKKFTPYMAKITAVFLWVETFFTSSLMYLLSSTVYPYVPGRYKVACATISLDWTYIMMEYLRYSIPLLMFIPISIILVCTIAFVVIMLKKRKPNNRRRRNSNRVKQENLALLQMLLILLSFLIGYLPITAYRITKMIGWNTFSRRRKWLFVTIYTLLMRMTECLNPIFYNLASSQMRKPTLQLIRMKILRRLPKEGTGTNTASLRTGVETNIH